MFPYAEGGFPGRRGKSMPGFDNGMHPFEMDNGPMMGGDMGRPRNSHSNNHNNNNRNQGR